jgi:hypothetical protein
MQEVSGSIPLGSTKFISEKLEIPPPARAAGAGPFPLFKISTPVRLACPSCA